MHTYMCTYIYIYIYKLIHTYTHSSMRCNAAMCSCRVQHCNSHRSCQFMSSLLLLLFVCACIFVRGSTMLAQTGLAKSSLSIPDLASPI